MKISLVLSLVLLVLSSCGTKVFNNKISVNLSGSSQASGIVSVFDYQMGKDRDWIIKQGKSLDRNQKLSFSYSSLKTVMIFDSSLPEKISFGLFIQPISDDGFFAIETEGKEVKDIDMKAIFVPFYGREAAKKIDLAAKYSLSQSSEGWSLEINILK